MNKEIFYTKIKSKVQENFLKGSDYELSKKELASIVFELFQETNRKPETKIEIEAKFVQTKYGIFSLNWQFFFSIYTFKKKTWNNQLAVYKDLPLRKKEKVYMPRQNIHHIKLRNIM